VNYNYNRKLL